MLIGFHSWTFVVLQQCMYWFNKWANETSHLTKLFLFRSFLFSPKVLMSVSFWFDWRIWILMIAKYNSKALMFRLDVFLENSMFCFQTSSFLFFVFIIYVFVTFILMLICWIGVYFSQQLQWFYMPKVLTWMGITFMLLSLIVCTFSSVEDWNQNSVCL